jgi:hypothetical protein
MPTKKPVLLGHTPSGVPVYDYAPDEPLLWPLLVALAQPDEALSEAATEQPESEALEDDGNDTRKP